MAESETWRTALLGRDEAPRCRNQNLLKSGIENGLRLRAEPAGTPSGTTDQLCLIVPCTDITPYSSSVPLGISDALSRSQSLS